MKRMHFAPSEVRVKFCKYLEKEDKELIHLAYGSANEDERRFYVGIAYKYRAESPCRYDIVTYDSETNSFDYILINLSYVNALIEMGKCIRKTTFDHRTFE